MELSKVSKVEELTKPEVVNAYLELGWKIISTYITSYDTDLPGCYHQTQHFVLAWGEGEPKYPEKPTPEWGNIGIVL